MFDILHNYLALFLVGNWPHGPLGGVAITLVISALGLAVSFPIAVAIGLALVSPLRGLRRAASIWTRLIRGIPLLMLIFWAYFAVPLLVGAEVSAVTTAVSAIIVYESAFLAQIVRAGLEGLPRGQMEAARSNGLSWLQSMRYVQLPQALANMLPSIVNQFVSIIKATSLAYVIGVPELTYSAAQVNTITLTKPLQTFLVLAAFYFILCFAISRFAGRLERRIARQRAGLA
ncbi:putative glutamine ABC transporter permease protein GlnP [Paraburkholderia hiiakae]|uniref:Glutamine ABC transporter permease protein GlnP n=1 Tax=Paraburkholderia hiiakae TaxID=1081782 RepID=A0ABN7ID27_9BURK|nr:amino acid ABC transporter permease [Paraburkholderia hiiakae]CAD6559411.1 putative glutamine ABC transporter permease protein GlnP [Paraburkholderia hiiakae]